MTEIAKLRAHVGGVTPKISHNTTHLLLILDGLDLTRVQPLLDVAGTMLEITFVAPERPKSIAQNSDVADFLNELAEERGLIAGLEAFNE